MLFVSEQLTYLDKKYVKRPIIEFRDLLVHYFGDILPKPNISYVNNKIYEVEFNPDEPTPSSKRLHKYSFLKKKSSEHLETLRAEIRKLEGSPSGPDRNQARAVLHSFEESWLSSSNLEMKDGNIALKYWGIKPRHFPFEISLEENKEEEPAKPAKPASPTILAPVLAIILFFLLLFVFLNRKNGIIPPDDSKDGNNYDDGGDAIVDQDVIVDPKYGNNDDGGDAIVDQDVIVDPKDGNKYIVSGFAVDSEGHRISRVRTKLRSDDFPNGNNYRTSTNDAGEFGLSLSTSGIYEVYASKSGFRFLGPDKLQVKPNGKFKPDPLIVKMVRVWSVSGVVLNRKGRKPLKGCTVEIKEIQVKSDKLVPIIQSKQTNANGRYYFPQLTKGTYLIRSTKKGFRNGKWKKIVIDDKLDPVEILMRKQSWIKKMLDKIF